RFAKSNSAPLVFQLGDQKCETYVSSAPGQPSRPVERLSNGQIRLGAPITTPRPGLKITPGGVIIPDPGPVDDPVTDPTETISTAPGPGSGPTETTTVDPCIADPTLPGCAPRPGDPSTFPA